MKIISDLHLHGRYSRACSKSLSIANLETYAKLKGINLLGTADFTHPKWIEEINNNLTEDDNGILRTKNGFPFIWSTEISLMYSQGGKGRKVHHVVLAPSGDVVKQITEALLKRGRIDYDGRPIFGMSSIEFVDMIMGISKDCEIIPAHIWTPWFGILGSKSGFDSIEECFQEKSRYIHAVETGLSSDPEMNWRLSKLDKYNLVSFSDSHSFWPWRLGREATIFDFKELAYKNLINALRTGKGLTETIEVDPNYGKYHFDGHRNCNVCLSPEESSRHKNICPVCKKELTIGVLNRVGRLADRDFGIKPKSSKPFRKLLPLAELISAALNSSLASKKVIESVFRLIKKYGDEFKILLEIDLDILKEDVDDKLAKLILMNRNGEIKINPGYDGEYGKQIDDGSPNRKDINKNNIKNKKNTKIQMSLDEF